MVEGVPADIWDYHRFTGLSPVDFLPSHIPSGLEWYSHEMARWVEEHQEPGPGGPLEVSVGYRLFSIDENRSVQEDLVILQRGHAWRL